MNMISLVRATEQERAQDVNLQLAAELQSCDLVLAQTPAKVSLEQSVSEGENPVYVEGITRTARNHRVAHFGHGVQIGR